MSSNEGVIHCVLAIGRVTITGSPKPKMLSSRIELETLAVLKPCDNQLHHESPIGDKLA